MQEATRRHTRRDRLYSIFSHTIIIRKDERKKEKEGLIYSCAFVIFLLFSFLKTLILSYVERKATEYIIQLQFFFRKNTLWY
jgi:hypothetical protein